MAYGRRNVKGGVVPGGLLVGFLRDEAKAFGMFNADARLRVLQAMRKGRSLPTAREKAVDALVEEAEVLRNKREALAGGVDAWKEADMLLELGAMEAQVLERLYMLMSGGSGRGRQEKRKKRMPVTDPSEPQMLNDVEMKKMLDVVRTGVNLEAKEKAIITLSKAVVHRPALLYRFFELGGVKSMVDCAAANAKLASPAAAQCLLACLNERFAEVTRELVHCGGISTLSTLVASFSYLVEGSSEEDEDDGAILSDSSEEDEEGMVRRRARAVTRWRGRRVGTWGSHGKPGRACHRGIRRSVGPGMSMVEERVTLLQPVLEILGHACSCEHEAMDAALESGTHRAVLAVLDSFDVNSSVGVAGARVLHALATEVRAREEMSQPSALPPLLAALAAWGNPAFQITALRVLAILTTGSLRTREAIDLAGGSVLLTGLLQGHRSVEITELAARAVANLVAHPAAVPAWALVRGVRDHVLVAVEHNIIDRNVSATGDQPWRGDVPDAPPLPPRTPSVHSNASSGFPELPAPPDLGEDEDGIFVRRVRKPLPPLPTGADPDLPLLPPAPPAPEMVWGRPPSFDAGMYLDLLRSVGAGGTVEALVQVLQQGCTKPTLSTPPIPKPATEVDELAYESNVALSGMRISMHPVVPIANSEAWSNPSSKWHAFRGLAFLCRAPENRRRIRRVSNLPDCIEASAIDVIQAQPVESRDGWWDAKVGTPAEAEFLMAVWSKGQE